MSNTTTKCLCLAGVFLFCLCPVFAQKGAAVKTVLRPRSYRLRTHQPKKAVERFNSSQALWEQVRMGGMSGLGRESLAPQPFDGDMNQIIQGGLVTIHTGREVLPQDFIEELSPQTRQWYKATLQPNGRVGFVPVSSRLATSQDEVAGAAEHGRSLAPRQTIVDGGIIRPQEQLVGVHVGNSDLSPEILKSLSPETRQWYEATLQPDGSVGFVPVSGGLAALRNEVARAAAKARLSSPEGQLWKAVTKGDKKACLELLNEPKFLITDEMKKEYVLTALDAGQFEMAKFLMEKFDVGPEQLLRYYNTSVPDEQLIIDFLNQYKLDHP